jgi:hypothetical protein
MRLAVRRLDPAAILPVRSYDGDAGFDLHALGAATLEPGERVEVRTGIAIELPERHAGLVLPRSGLAARSHRPARRRARRDAGCCRGGEAGRQRPWRARLRVERQLTA